MPEINALPVATAMTDDDLFVIYENGAASNKSRQITKANALTGYIATGDAATLGVVDADELNAPIGAIDTLAVATSLTIGAEIEKILSATGTLTLGNILSGAEGSGTVTVTGAVTGDQAILQLPSTFPLGLLLSRAVVTGANTVTAYFFNPTGGTINGAGYSVRASVIRFG
jgi:hypothetical protein